jgi:hypothetical protein
MVAAATVNPGRRSGDRPGDLQRDQGVVVVKVRRAIDIYEGDEIDEGAFRSLVGAAAALNASSARG